MLSGPPRPPRTGGRRPRQRGERHGSRGEVIKPKPKIALVLYKLVSLGGLLGSLPLSLGSNGGGRGDGGGREGRRSGRGNVKEPGRKGRMLFFRFIFLAYSAAVPSSSGVVVW